jgi:diguanylate cyclase (GGDEF)-like protein
MVFLSSILVYSYKYTHDVIFNEVENNLKRTMQLFESQLESERNELARNAGIVSDDLRIQEYMFVVARVGSDSEPLRKLYERLFGWLPIDRRVIISDKGQVLVGEQYTDLAKWVNANKDKAIEYVHYFKGEQGLELVSIAPIFYSGEKLGVVAVTRVINKAWLQLHRKNSGGHLFVEQSGKILQSTFTNLPDGDLHIDKLKIKNGQMFVNDEIYRVYSIDLPNIGEELPNLWFALSETQLIKTLETHSRFTMMLVIISGLTILFIGIMIFRNFNRPLTALMSMTQEITEGRLPVMVKSDAQNEIDVLANKFADMLQALREKQSEIDRVHKQLETSAITDTLTSLYNRRHLQEVFPKLRAQAQRDWNNLAIIICDLDYFKKINDQYGHLAGDQCLVHFSKLLKQHSRSNDYLFRIGGEEFLIVSINRQSNGGVTIAEKIRAATADSPVVYRGKTIPITVSCGVSFSDDEDTQETALPRLLSRADKALYEAKNRGRNVVCIYEDMVLQDMAKGELKS